MIVFAFSFSWSLNGTLIDLENDYRRRMSGGSLIISNLDKDRDSGIYQCKAFNARGAILSRKARVQFACEYSKSPARLLTHFIRITRVDPPDAYVIGVWLRSSRMYYSDCLRIDSSGPNGHGMKLQMQRALWEKQPLNFIDSY